MENFFGLGVDSNLNNITRSTVVIPENATITSLTLNIRNNTFSSSSTAEAEIFIISNCEFFVYRYATNSLHSVLKSAFLAVCKYRYLV